MLSGSLSVTHHAQTLVAAIAKKTKRAQAHNEQIIREAPRE